MESLIRGIAKDEAARAVLPVATWANEALLPYVNRVAAMRAQSPAPSGSAEGDALPLPAPSALPVPARPRGAPIAHRLMPKLLALVAAGAQPMLIGPAGTGKSHAARAVAETLGFAFGAASLSAGVSESTLLGWLLPVGESGRFDYVPSPFVSLYESGRSVFLLDEIDAASPDMLVIANSALANGGFSVAQRFAAPYVTRGEHAVIIAAANTVDGADEMYSARSQIDAATLNRFYPLSWQHDAKLERALAHLPARQTYWTPKGRTEWTAEAFALASECAISWIDAVRQVIQRSKLARVFSVRQTMQYQCALRAGCTHAEIRADLLLAWSPDEIAKLPPSAQPKNAPAVGDEASPVPSPSADADADASNADE
jgi:hypothetical protein